MDGLTAYLATEGLMTPPPSGTPDTQETTHDCKPRQQIPPVPAHSLAGSAVAEPGHHPSPNLDEHRPARRQPVPDRPDVGGDQVALLRHAGGDRLQGNRGGL